MPVAQPTGEVSGGGSEDRASGVDTGSDLYVVDPATGAIEPVLVRPGRQEDPERSPDGEWLVYQSVVPGGVDQIMLLEDDGTERRLTSVRGGATDPTWSPDGTQIAFAARWGNRADTDIFVMDVDGGHPRRLAGTARNDRHPDWSPEGSRIVFHSRYQAWHGILPRGEIWVVSVRDGGLTHLDLSTPFWGGYWNGADPAWSPDGRWIAYTRLAGSTINGMSPYAPLWLMRADGTGQRSVHRWSKRWGDCEVEASWSPDGSSIAYVGAGDSATRIWIVDVRTRAFDSISTPAPVADLDWGTEGILVRMGEGPLERHLPIRCA
ncbi:MAG TPA: hypothetical protein VIC58_03845 [Actinomycetota bacterium]